MFQNRISRYFESESVLAGAADQARSQSTQGQIPGMVWVPATAVNVPWQSQLYRLAYEQAVIDLEPPRHFGRYFSVWN